MELKMRIGIVGLCLISSMTSYVLGLNPWGWSTGVVSALHGLKIGLMYIVFVIMIGVLIAG